VIQAGNPLLDPAARLVIGHRGNRVSMAENTLESFSQAVEIGADAVEFDVRLTRDGVPVVMHDANLDRTTDARGPVRSYTLSELRTVDAGARSPTAGGKRLRVPTLEEVFETLRQTPFVIEVKEMAAAEPTERVVRKFGAQNRVLIGSSDTMVMERFYRSGLSSCASMRDAILFIPLALVGLAPLFKPRYDVLSLTPQFHGFPIPVQRMASVARKSGIATQVWTVNDPAIARSYWAGGVAGIVTDDPVAMIRARGS
jgi:glycerophosphoryl diester phosphodiesterase